MSSKSGKNGVAPPLLFGVMVVSCDPNELALDKPEILAKICCIGINDRFMATDKSFQERLSRVFDQRSMADIARRLELPHATIRNYFGGRLPAPEVLIKMAEVTNVSLNWLLTGKGEMYAGEPKGLDIGRVLDARIIEIVDRRLAEKLEPDVQQLGTIDEP